MNLKKSIAKVQRATNRVFWTPILVLEVTDQCNGRCVMCDLWNNGEKHELDGGDMESLVLSLKKRGLRSILVTGGEPLLRRDIFEFCERLSRHRIELILNTNGLLLEKFGQEVADHFSMVIVSLDSHDPVGYEEIRGCDEFPNVIEGIKSLKKRGGWVMLSHTLQKTNIHGLAEFVSFSKALGVERISVRPVDAFSSAFGRNRPRPDLFEKLIPSEQDIEELSRLIEVIGKECRQDIQDGFLRPGVKGLRMVRDYFLACRGRGDFPERECDMPFVSLTVEAGGHVKPCFFLDSFSIVNEVDGSRRGNIIKHRGLADVRRLYKKGGIEECRRCVQPYAEDF
ncbi:MAG: radical SAM protein [Candidatus Aminicenantes bacterium]|nr:radical SAM protein [Candidatus Aminicenantes bacterium]